MLTLRHAWESRRAIAISFISYQFQPSTIHQAVQVFADQSCCFHADCRRGIFGFNPPARTPHAFRHTFAIHYLRKGGSVFHIQKVLGHSTLEMTRRYANLMTEDLQAVHERVSLLSAFVICPVTPYRAAIACSTNAQARSTLAVTRFKNSLRYRGQGIP